MNKNQIGKFVAGFGLSVFVALGLISGFWTVSAHDTDEEAVKKVLMQEARAIETGDLETLDKLWSHGDSVLIFESGGVDKGWQNYRDHHLAPELKVFKNTKYAVSDVNVKVNGKTAWATFKYALSADYKERKIESNGVGTMVFEKADGKWLIVHSHTSARRSQPAAQSSSAGDINNLIEKLRVANLNAEPGEKISQPFFSTEGQVLKVGDEIIQIFRYENAATAEKEMGKVSPQGSPVGTTMINWVAPPHFYRSGNTIALYVGKNPKIINALESVFGKQFAGK